METLEKSPRSERREAAPVAPAQPAPPHEDHDEIPTVESLPRPRRSIVVVVAVVLVIAIVLAFGAGFIPRMHRSAEMDAGAAAAANDLPVVSVQYPKVSSQSTELDLPGNMQP